MSIEQCVGVFLIILDSIDVDDETRSKLNDGVLEWAKQQVVKAMMSPLVDGYEIDHEATMAEKSEFLEKNSDKVLFGVD